MRTAAEQLAHSRATGRDAALAAIVEHESAFLANMEQIVKLVEGEAGAAVRRLRRAALGIALVIVALLLGLGRFVVRPAVATIRVQVDELEDRVALRTRELNEALTSLRRETQERHSVEARNRELAAQLVHADRVQSLGRLAAGLAHELNQPLGAIVNYAEACDAALAAPVDEKVQHRVRGHVRRLRQASLRAGEIVRRMRNFVRPSPGSLVAVDLRTLIAEVVDFCRPLAIEAEVDVALELPSKSVLVWADPIQIQQVLVNLLQNALQAMTADAQDVRRLTIRMAQREESVQIDVADNGPGLADAMSAELFEPFQTTKSDGLGLGLSICRAIIEQHQGTIWARPLPHAGAQFSFELPFMPAHALPTAS
jgi:two-component system sensor kinase FixL